MGNWQLRERGLEGDATRSRQECMAHPQDFNYTEAVTQSYAMRWLRGWSRREPWTHAAFNPDGRPKPFFVYKSYTVPHAGGWGNSNEDGAPVPDAGPFAKETSWPEVQRDPNLAHISPISRPHLAHISPTSRLHLP